MEFPTVSIVIMSYNNFEYLYNAIDSVLAQTYPAIEVLIADDASIDFDAREVEQYIRSHMGENICGVQVYSNPSNYGTVRNANTAVKKSCGRYIRFLAADDELANSSVICQMVDFIKAKKTLVVTSKFAMFDKDMKNCIGILPKVKIVNILNEESSKDMLFFLLTTRNVIGACGVMYDRLFFDQEGGFDESYRLTEDWPTWLRLIRSNHRIPCMDEVTSKYRIGGISNGSENSATAKQLIADMTLMYKHEVAPFVKSSFLKRYCAFVQEKYSYKIENNTFKKVIFILKNVDIIIYRKLIRG